MLSFIPSEFNKLKHLEELVSNLFIYFQDVSYNQLDSLNIEICDIYILKVLFLNNNVITFLPTGKFFNNF